MFGFSMSTIGIILIAAVVLIVALKILTGLLRIGIAAAVIGIGGYWLYTHFFTNVLSTFPK